MLNAYKTYNVTNHDDIITFNTALGLQNLKYQTELLILQDIGRPITFSYESYKDNINFFNTRKHYDQSLFPIYRAICTEIDHYENILQPYKEDSTFNKYYSLSFIRSLPAVLLRYFHYTFNLKKFPTLKSLYAVAGVVPSGKHLTIPDMHNLLSFTFFRAVVEKDIFRYSAFFQSQYERYKQLKKSEPAAFNISRNLTIKRFLTDIYIHHHQVDNIKIPKNEWRPTHGDNLQART